MPKWKCEACGNTVEAPREPEQCPCGSEDVAEVEKPGLLETVKSLVGI